MRNVCKLERQWFLEFYDGCIVLYYNVLEMFIEFEFLSLLIGLLFSIAALSDVDLSGENDIAFINSVSDVCNWHVTYSTLPAFFTAGVTACTKHDSSPPEI